MQHEIAAFNPAQGDIFYVLVNQKHFFMQVIHIETPGQPFSSMHQYGVFVVVFQKTFSQLPQSISELNLHDIYQPKYIWKNTLFYFSLWDAAPQIRFNPSIMRFDYKDKYALTFFANAAVSNTLNPSIDAQFGMPAISVDNENSIQISHTPSHIQTIIWAIEEDEKGKAKKLASVNPLYLKNWLTFVAPECIIKTEKILLNYAQNKSDSADKSLKKAVIALNKLDAKMCFIFSVEAENLITELIEMAAKKGLANQLAEVIINENRDW